MMAMPGGDRAVVLVARAAGVQVAAARGARARRDRAWCCWRSARRCRWSLEAGSRQEADAARASDRPRPTALPVAGGAARRSQRQPKGMVFTFVDLGPRLITVTHHDAIVGPYHRNAGDRRRDERLPRATRRRRTDRRRISLRLSADLPRHVDRDDLHGRGAEGLLRAAGQGARCRPGCSRSSCRKNSPFRMWKVVR